MFYGFCPFLGVFVWFHCYEESVAKEDNQSQKKMRELVIKAISVGNVRYEKVGREA